MRVRWKYPARVSFTLEDSHAITLNEREEGKVQLLTGSSQ